MGDASSPMPDDAERKLAELAYQRAIAAVEYQSDTIDNLRARSTALLAFVSTVSVFLIREAIKDVDDAGEIFSGGGILAAAFSFVFVALAVAINWPRSFALQESGEAILDEAYAEMGTAAALHQLATYKSDAWETNKGRLDVMLSLFQWQLVLSLFVLFAWAWRSIAVL